MDRAKFPVEIKTAIIKRPRLEIYYPQVRGISNLNAMKIINHDIYDVTYESVREQGYFESPQTTIEGYYEIKTNEREILSLSLINYAYSGGAHGLTITKSLTFDVSNGKSFVLRNLFKENSNYVELISDNIKKQIVDREIPLLGQFQTIRPDQDYYIADKALVIYFQLYEITPYAYGFPHFPISIYELENIIDENGPLGNMLY